MLDYERAFQMAIADDENHRWRSARRNYARAGQLLLQGMSDMSPSDWDCALQSVSRLMAAAERMKALEDQERAAAPAGQAGDSSARRGDEECDFQPVSERPSVHFDDIAGLRDAKETIRREIVQPWQRPDVYQRFHQNTNGGILLFGPPGTGKTMLARCIATETDADFFYVRCSDIVGKYFGEAERRLKALFQAARDSGNAIIFFDEFEALGCKRGGHSTVMNRVVPELLSQMDGFEKSEGRMVVIAATNRPWALDSAFLRPPRLTHHIYVPLPDCEARLYLLKRLFRELPCKGEIDLAALARATEGFNCADVSNLVSQATRDPIDRAVRSGDSEQFVTPPDVEKALRSARSSVQPEDIAEMEKWIKARR